MALPNRKNVARFLAESNRIEGIEFDEKCFLDTLNGAGSESLHISNSVAAWKYVLKNRKKEIHHGEILTVHRLQMNGILAEEEAGHWRTGQVIVGGHVPPKASVLHFHMQRFVERVNDLTIGSMELHCEFETAHPFWDGNGRVGRLLWAWTRMQRGERVIPILDLFPIDFSDSLQVAGVALYGEFKVERRNYYNRLQRYQNGHG